jgi:sigma-B regulation protein RsbU (phosphoserine phosphatase)
LTRPNSQLNESRVPDLDVAKLAECKLCHDEIPVAQMAGHPHIAICLECMSEDQRTALQDDLELAARVQRELLPSKSISYDGWEFSYIWEPFGSVSGDHIDLLCPVRDKGPLHLLLGDVSGKGVAASLLQSNLHALFRALAPVETSLSGLFGRASSLFFEATASESYATLTGLRLFPDGRAELANAGHPRPLIADERGVRPVEDASLPLGMFDGAKFSERQLKLEPGETLLLYTDGWTEAEVDGEMYGVGRAAAALRRSMHLPLPELLAACRADMERFLGGAPRNDDLTLVALRRTESH